MTDEDRLVELLREHRELEGSRADAVVARRLELESAILELVDTYFRRALRPLLTKTLGANLFATESDPSWRYTAMVHDFFVKVLEKRPDAFWKAQTAQALRTWSSVVIANQMRDYLRRKRLGQHILAELAPLVEQRQSYFESRYPITFADFLEQLAIWEAHGGQTSSQQARALRHRYVDGLTWREIAQQLGVTDERLSQLRDAAAERLRTVCSSEG